MFYILGVVACLLIILYRFSISTYDYWKKRNVPFHQPVAFFGNLKETLLMQKSFGQVYTDIYKSHEDVPYVGFYKIRTPSLLIRDPEIVKDIIIKDFHSFEKNDFPVDEAIDPIAARNPFFQFGSRWKISRSQLTYCFTAGKMKHMFPLMHEVSNNMVKYLENESRIANNLFDAKELSAKFTTDNVASCAFGLEGKSFADPNSEFRNVGRKILQPSFFLNLKFLIILLFPSSSKLFNLRLFPVDVVNYFRDIIKSTFKYRKENGIVRNDFLDIVSQMKVKPGEPSISHDDITAHSLSFFADGFETSSIALSFALYNLAAHIDIQEKLRREIEEVLKSHNGTLDYEAIQDMKYLDCVLSESLRIHSPALFLSKVCTAEYKLRHCKASGGEIIVEEGTPIIIPVRGLHNDSKYFRNPEKFDPERFSDDNKSEIVKGSYIPFGEGPRICVGMKFAILQVKVALVALVRNFDIRVNKKTLEPIEVDPNHFLLLAKGGLWLDFHQRNK